MSKSILDMTNEEIDAEIEKIHKYLEWLKSLKDE